MGADEETARKMTGLALLDLHYDLKALIISYVSLKDEICATFFGGFCFVLSLFLLSFG
jgi:hypothetical protein